MGTIGAINAKLRGRWISLKPLQRAVLLTLVGVIAAGAILLGVRKPEFFSVANVRNILIQVSAYAIMTFGMSLVLITKGIDLSVSSVLSFSAVTGAVVMLRTGSVFLGLCCVFLSAAACGAVNGIAISWFKMAPFVVTMAMMIVAEAVGTILSNSRTIVVPASFQKIATGTILMIPVPIVILAVTAFGMHMLLSHTVFGRWIYAVGINSEATNVCSIPTKLVVFLVYTLSALMASIGGLILTARLGSASLATTSDTTTLDVICSAIIGGVSIYGGVGTIAGALFGAVFVFLFQNIMNLFGVDYFVAMMVRCGVILVATLIDTVLSKGRR